MSTYTNNGGIPSNAAYNQDLRTGSFPLPAVRSEISTNDSAAIDPFGRWRVSNPETISDSKNIFYDSGIPPMSENQPLFYDNQEVSGSGTFTYYEPNKSQQVVAVSGYVEGTRVRQTKVRFNYQPGKGQEAIMTFNLSGKQDNIIKREGIFDDKNGIFLEVSGQQTSFVTRSYTTGSAVDTKILQEDWNVDKFDGNGKSGITIDFTKAQILFIDYEWLGVGRVRAGFVIDGIPLYANYSNHANNEECVYMQTPNLPLRSEISNNGLGEAASMTQICSTIISEGGSNDLGIIRRASTNGTHIVAATENTPYAVLGIRLKDDYIGATVKILNTAIQIQSATDKIEWLLLLNPTVASTFNYYDETNSAIQVARGVAANTIIGGIQLAGGFLESGGAQTGNAASDNLEITNAIRLGSLIDGTKDTIVLAVRPIGGSSDVSVEGSMTWRELL